MKKTLSYIGYWILQCTWGLPMTLIGAIVALVLLITGHKPKTLGPNVYFEVGKNWGGLELGGFFICGKDSPERTKFHEAGHGLQNIIWGPLFPFVIAIPSALRYWVRKMPTPVKKVLFNLGYLLISFILLTGIILLTGPVFHLHITTHIFEGLRLYCALSSIWLALFEIPKYLKPDAYVDYDAIWFEGQATKWGTKIYNKEEKKED